MQKHLSLVFILALALLSPAISFAHGGAAHSHEAVTEVEAKKRAVAAVVDFVSQRKVDGSWKSRQPSLQKKKFGKQTEWVATFENPEAKDLTKKRLYVFLSLSGELLGANHTGN